jgi:hypothetical protein
MGVLEAFGSLHIILGLYGITLPGHTAFTSDKRLERKCRKIKTRKMQEDSQNENRYL